MGYDGANLALGQRGGLVALRSEPLQVVAAPRSFLQPEHFAQCAHLCQRSDPKALQNQITA